MKNLIQILYAIGIIMLASFACKEDNVVENNIFSQPTINVGQTSSDTVGIAITASNSKAATQTTNVAFTKDTILVSYTVSAYGNGEATITLSNSAMESKNFDLNSNKSIAQEPIYFKPESVNINIKEGYTGVVSMALIAK